MRHSWTDAVAKAHRGELLCEVSSSDSVLFLSGTLKDLFFFLAVEKDWIGENKGSRKSFSFYFCLKG